MKPTLVVIDMQDRFIWRTSLIRPYNETIDKVKELLQAAIKNNQHIIFVEFSIESFNDLGPFGKEPCKTHPTLKELTRIVEGYPHVTYVYKTHRAGGVEILEAVKALCIPNIHYEVCGVFTSHCVRETVLEMSSLGSGVITVNGNAVVDYHADANAQELGLQEMVTYRNVCVNFVK